VELGAKTAWGLAAAVCGLAIAVCGFLAMIMLTEIMTNSDRIAELETAFAVHAAEHDRAR